MRRRWGMLAFAAVVVLTLSGCSIPGGPLSGLNRGVIECVDAAGGDDISVGIEVKNSGAAPLTITDVSFGTLDGVTLAGSWVAGSDKVADGEHGYGVGPFPPDVSFNPGWPDRVEAAGSEIPGDLTTWVVVRLHRDEDAAPGVPRLASGPRITYSVNGFSFVADSDFIAGFGVDSDCDTSDDEP